MEEEVTLQQESVHMYKQDIDDNCPMTGDETDTEVYHDILRPVPTCSDSENVNITNEAIELPSESSPRKKKSEMTSGDFQDLFPQILARDNEEEEESLSSDRNYFSDEETSSVAGSFDDFGIDDEDSLSEPVSEKNREEKLRRMALRQHLDQLGELVIEKECAVTQARNELQKCQEYLEQLQLDLSEANNQGKEAEKKKQKAAYYRLKSKQDKLWAEINVEKDVEAKLLQNLESAEFNLAQTYIEHAKFLPLDEELEDEEKRLDKLKTEKASARIKKETNAALVLERRKKSRDKEHISAFRERERKSRQALISAKKNREVAVRYLKETMDRVRQRESEEEDKSRSDLNQRMSALLSLKRNIELNKENINAVQAQDSHINKKEKMKEDLERQKLISMGENPDEVLTRRKRIRQFERDKEAFERKQREREIEIVNKVILEEKQMKRRYQQQPQLWPDNRPRRVPRKRSKPRFAPSSGSESMEYGADVEDTGGKISYIGKVSTDDEGEFSPYGATNRDDDRETTEDDEVAKDESGIQHDEGEEENLAKPEFKGLWEQEEIQEDVDKPANWKTSTREYSKYEQGMMKNALSKQKQSIVQKQVAAGREFKGAAFYSKPEIVLFKDFDVGKTYKQKVLLTNISYSQNYCQYIGVTEKLKDFIDVLFSPPGSMSAGLTCDLTVTFKPMINEDMEGCIKMMAQTGLFYIPIKCLIKRCEVCVDAHEVDFDTQVVGETRKRSITLKNTGALSTDFTFYKTCNSDSDEKRDVEASDTNVNNEESQEDGDTAVTGDKQPVGVTESNEKVDSMRVGKVACGTLAPFSSTQLDILFSPVQPGNISCEFHIVFTDPKLKPVMVIAKALAIDLPVWVEREVVDLKICTYDRLYQDAIIVNNRATSALRLRFEQPKELRNHLEILPKTAYVQAESQFSAQLKFLPRKTLLTDAECFVNKKSMLLEVPITLRVADQTQPVKFVLQTVLTSSDLEFDANEVNFGYCTVCETVYKTIQLHNKSVLPQRYGFAATPEVIDVQPNDGFGTILPDEKLLFDISFNPTKAQDYKFDLICKSHIGREFLLRCKGVGVLPPLKLSDSLIKFRATAVNDTSSTFFSVINDHTSTNQFTHPVPRIGNGDIFPVGPTSFHFVVPNNAPITISPCVGTVFPGEKCVVHITFSPRLDDNVIDAKTLELVEEEQFETIQCVEEKTEAKHKEIKTKNQKGNSRAKGNTSQTQSPGKQLANNKRTPDRSNQRKQAQLYLQRNYENMLSSYKIPCFIAYGECVDSTNMQYNVHNTLYLEAHCPSVRPSLIVVSESGDNLVDFAKVSVGQRHSQIVSLQNISSETLTLSSSVLDPLGPFEAVNALRPIEPNDIFSVKLSFTPQKNDDFYEVLEVSSLTDTVRIRLKGQGVKPSITLEPTGDTFDVGDALIMDTVVAALKVTNASELSLVFDLTLGSLLTSKHSRTQTLPAYLKQFKYWLESSDCSFLIGPPNRSSLCVFGCKPAHGILNPGESKDIMISFSPDHASELYRDELLINVNGAEEFTHVHLVGRGWPNIAFARGWDRLIPAEESLVNGEKEDIDAKSHEKTVLLTFHSVLTDSTSPAERIIELGCIKSSTQTKKSCDFVIENTKDANEKGFTIDPLKGGVDIGARRDLSFKWTIPPQYDPGHLIKSSVQLVMRGDATVTYNIILRGYVICSVPS